MFPLSRQTSKTKDNGSKLDKKKDVDEERQIYYKGNEITTYRDILNLISLFPPDNDAKNEAKELSADFFD